MLKVTDEEKPFYSAPDKYAKDKNGKTIADTLNFMSKHMYVFTKNGGITARKIKSKRKFSKDFMQWR